MKRAQGLPLRLITLAIIALVVIVVAIYAYITLFGGGTGAVAELIEGFGTPEIDLGGTQKLDQSCTSSWNCFENLACVDNVCVSSTTSQFKVRGKADCYNGYIKFENKGVLTDASCSVVYFSGKYQLEINSDKSGRIKKGGDAGSTQNIFIYMKEASGVGVPFPLYEEQYGSFYRDKEAENKGWFKFSMNPNNIYIIDAPVNFKICGWVKDSNCDDNSDSVTLRVDKIEEQPEKTEKEIDTSNLVACTDSDGGINVAEKGTSSGNYYVGGEKLSGEDYCTNNELTEIYCQPAIVSGITHSWLNYIEIDCIKAGYDSCDKDTGRCIGETGLTCTDTEDGIIFTEKGFVTGQLITDNYNVYLNVEAKPDECIGNVIRDFYCLADDGRINHMLVDCIKLGYTKCENGVCVDEGTQRQEEEEQPTSLASCEDEECKVVNTCISECTHAAGCYCLSGCARPTVPEGEACGIKLIDCVDSDNDNIITEKGTSSGNSYLTGQQIELIYDVCVDDTLTEFYCQSATVLDVDHSWLYYESINCVELGYTKCEDGACV